MAWRASVCVRKRRETIQNEFGAINGVLVQDRESQLLGAITAPSALPFLCEQRPTTTLRRRNTFPRFDPVSHAD
jgi:hypothetical protein